MLSDSVDIVMGQSPKGEFVNGDGHGFPLLNGPTEFGPSHPLPTQFTEKGVRFAEPGDLLFCVRGSTTGRMNWADQRYAIGRGIAAIRHSSDLRLQPLVRGLIEGQLPTLLAAATGSTFPNVTGKMIGSLNYSELAQPEQLEAAITLGQIDDKIELNRRMNETLEEMARALFRDWFVDFGPTCRQIEGATDPVAIMGGAFPLEKAATLAPFFPTKLGDEGLPQGWGWATVGELTEKVTKGTTPRKADVSNSTSDETVPFYRVVNLSKCGQLLQNSVQKVPLDVHLGALKRSVLQANDILYSIAGTIGRVCKLEQRDVPANLNQALAIVRPDNSRTTANYLLLALRSPAFQDELHSNIVQAVQANLSLGMISSAPMLTLAIDDLRQIMEPIDLLLSKHDANEQETQTLAEMRDLLLPKLMSGEIRLKDAEDNL